MSGEYRTGPGVSSDRFRELLGSFPTGVTVLSTTGDDGSPIGMTVSSLTSVSLDPPLLLVCLHHGARAEEALQAGRPFGLSILAADQHDLSRRFADRDTGFSDVPSRTERGFVFLNGASATIECQVWKTVPAGDHTIYLGLVTGGDVTDRPPLIHHRSRYTAPR